MSRGLGLTSNKRFRSATNAANAGFGGLTEEGSRSVRAQEHATRTDDTGKIGVNAQNVRRRQPVQYGSY
jgi:hypothetical protein